MQVNSVNKIKDFEVFKSNSALEYYDAVAESVHFDAHDGVKIHYSQITDPRNKNLLVILPGRTEPAQKYAEMAYDLRFESHDIIIIDHRGQGLSGRLLENSKIGHVENFIDYVLDLEDASKLIGRKKKYDKKIMLAHSMGSIIGLLQAQRNPLFWDGLILGSPMLELKTRSLPSWIAKNLFKVMKGVGLADGYVPGGADEELMTFENNTVTQCHQRYRMARYIEERQPELFVSDPSPNWVLEGLRGSQEALEGRHMLKMPILMFQAGLDEYVYAEAQNQFDESLANCTKVILEDSFHEVFQEKDSIRDVAIKSIKRFLK